MHLVCVHGEYFFFTDITDTKKKISSAIKSPSRGPTVPEPRQPRVPTRGQFPVHVGPVGPSGQNITTQQHPTGEIPWIIRGLRVEPAVLDPGEETRSIPTGRMGGDVACVALLETTSGRCNERPLADTNQVQVAPLRSVGHRGRAHVNLQQGSVQSSHEKLVCPSTVLVHALIVAPVDSPLVSSFAPLATQRVTNYIRTLVCYMWRCPSHGANCPPTLRGFHPRNRHPETQCATGSLVCGPATSNVLACMVPPRERSEARSRSQ